MTNVKSKIVKHCGKTTSKHLKGRLVPRGNVTFLHHKGFCHFPVSGHFMYSVTLSLPWTVSGLSGHFPGDKFRFLILNFYFFRKFMVFQNISAINRGLSIRTQYRSEAVIEALVPT